MHKSVVNRDTRWALEPTGIMGDFLQEASSESISLEGRVKINQPHGSKAGFRLWEQQE